MGDTLISWTQKTWNWLRGCSRTKAKGADQSGCGDQTGGGCYAERNAWRFAGPGLAYEGLVRMTANGPRWTGKVIVVDEHLLDPLKWRSSCKVFTNSVSDPFHESLTNEQIALGYGVMAVTERHTYQNLTKRAKRRREWFQWVADKAAELRVTPATYCILTAGAYVAKNCSKADADRWFAAVREVSYKPKARSWPLSNVWEGVSVENQAAADERIDHLFMTPAAVRWLSIEPMIGPVDLIRWLDPSGSCDCHPGESWCIPNCARDAEWRGFDTPPDSEVSVDPAIDWVVIGAESGPRARQCSIEWVAELLDRLGDYNVPRFLKQLVWAGEDGVTIGMGAFSKGRGYQNRTLLELPYLDGKQYKEYPRVD